MPTSQRPARRGQSLQTASPADRSPLATRSRRCVSVTGRQSRRSTPHMSSSPVPAKAQTAMQRPSTCSLRAPKVIGVSIQRAAQHVPHLKRACGAAASMLPHAVRQCFDLPKPGTCRRHMCAEGGVQAHPALRAPLPAEAGAGSGRAHHHHRLAFVYERP